MPLQEIIDQLLGIRTQLKDTLLPSQDTAILSALIILRSKRQRQIRRAK